MPRISWHVKVLSNKTCLHSQLQKHNRSCLISIYTFLLLSYDFRDSEARCNRKDLPLISKFSCVFWEPIRVWSGYGTVINYVEVILKIYTDNGAAVIKDILYT